MAGDVSATGAVIWSRTDRSSRMEVDLEGRPAVSVQVSADDDFAGKVELEGLTPATVYTYRVRFGTGPVAKGRFRTAPGPGDPRPVRIAFGGDVAGQDVCRDAQEGFPIFATVRAYAPDLFIGLGDMIYADNRCTAKGRYGNAQIPGAFVESTEIESFWAHWKYSREDPELSSLLGETGYVAVWDDHEVANDFDPGHPLLALGLRAFLDYNPLRPSLYRTLRWGKHLELFVLDTRGERDANRRPDSGGVPKSMLGPAQRRWLTKALGSSDATWKVIVTSVPLSVPTGSRAPARGRDGWANGRLATGFERELRELLREISRLPDANVLFLTTDVHFAQVLRYRPFDDAPGFEPWELITGPLNAGIYPRTDLDPSLRPERLFLFGPGSPGDVKTWEQAKTWFNFGALETDAQGRLTLRVVRTDGDTVFERTLSPR